MAAMKIEDGESDGATHANASVAPGPAPDVSCLEHCGDAIHAKAMGLIDMGDCTALNDVDKACFNRGGVRGGQDGSEWRLSGDVCLMRQIPGRSGRYA